MGKYIPVQTNHGVTGDVLIEISDKTVLGLVLPEIVYNVKKKLGCIFVENHNSEPLMLKRGETIRLVSSCIVTQAEQGQKLGWLKNNLVPGAIPYKSRVRPLNPDQKDNLRYQIDEWLD